MYESDYIMYKSEYTTEYELLVSLGSLEYENGLFNLQYTCILLVKRSTRITVLYKTVLYLVYIQYIHIYSTIIHTCTVLYII